MNRTWNLARSCKLFLLKPTNSLKEKNYWHKGTKKEFPIILLKCMMLMVSSPEFLSYITTYKIKTCLWVEKESDLPLIRCKFINKTTSEGRRNEARQVLPCQLCREHKVPKALRSSIPSCPEPEKTYQALDSFLYFKLWNRSNCLRVSMGAFPETALTELTIQTTFEWSWTTHQWGKSCHDGAWCCPWWIF